jgi:hypothetical protein
LETAVLENHVCCSGSQSYISTIGVDFKICTITKRFSSRSGTRPDQSGSAPLRHCIVEALTASLLFTTSLMLNHSATLCVTKAATDAKKAFFTMAAKIKNIAAQPATYAGDSKRSTHTVTRTGLTSSILLHILFSSLFSLSYPSSTISFTSSFAV